MFRFFNNPPKIVPDYAKIASNIDVLVDDHDFVTKKSKEDLSSILNLCELNIDQTVTLFGNLSDRFTNVELFEIFSSASINIGSNVKTLQMLLNFLGNNLKCSFFTSISEFIKNLQIKQQEIIEMQKKRGEADNKRLVNSIMDQINKILDDMNNNPDKSKNSALQFALLASLVSSLSRNDEYSSDDEELERNKQEKIQEINNNETDKPEMTNTDQAESTDKNNQQDLQIDNETVPFGDTKQFKPDSILQNDVTDENKENTMILKQFKQDQQKILDKITEIPDENDEKPTNMQSNKDDTNDNTQNKEIKQNSLESEQNQANTEVKSDETTEIEKTNEVPQNISKNKENVDQIMDLIHNQLGKSLESSNDVPKMPEFKQNEEIIDPEPKVVEISSKSLKNDQKPTVSTDTLEQKRQEEANENEKDVKSQPTKTDSNIKKQTAAKTEAKDDNKPNKTVNRQNKTEKSSKSQPSKNKANNQDPFKMSPEELEKARQMYEMQTKTGDQSNNKPIEIIMDNENADDGPSNVETYQTEYELISATLFMLKFEQRQVKKYKNRNIPKAKLMEVIRDTYYREIYHEEFHSDRFDSWKLLEIIQPTNYYFQNIYSALDYAVSVNQMITFVMARFQNYLRVRDEQKNTLLIHAAKSDNLKLARALLAWGDIDINSCNDNKETALFWFTFKNNLDGVRLILLYTNLDVNLARFDGLTPLMMAAMFNNYGLVNQILNHLKINVNQKNKKGMTAINFAKSNLVKQLLLKKGAMPTSNLILDYTKAKITNQKLPDYKQDRSQKIKTKCLEALCPSIDSLRKLSKTESNFDSIYDLLVSARGDSDVFKFAKENGYLDVKGIMRTPLIVRAAAENDLQLVKNLVNHGVDINACDDEGYGVLYWFSQYGNEDALSWLASRKDVDGSHQDVDGFSPLMSCVASRNEKLVSTFVNSKIPYYHLIKNNKGENSYDIASNKAISDLLQNHDDFQPTRYFPVLTGPSTCPFSYITDC